MPTRLQPTSSPLSGRLVISGFAKTLRLRWAALLERPFPRLVAHFASVILQSGQESGAAELNLGIGGILALLAAPGAFASLLLFPKYSSFLRWLSGRRRFDVYWASLPEKYFFIVLAMVITGVVVAVKWDKIFPSGQDYANLAQLPLKSRTIFFANLCAIVLLATIFAVDLNAASTLMMPGVVLSERGTFLELFVFMGVHATCVVLASAFTFFSCFALLGLLMSALPNRVFRRVSVFVRLTLIVALIVLLCTNFAVVPAIRQLPSNPHSLVRFLPPIWYLGLYQSLQGRTNPPLVAAAWLGLKAVLAAFFLALAFSTLSYRRYFMRIPESLMAGQSASRWHLDWLAPLADRLFLKSPFQRACYRFGIRALLRSETHSILFGAFAGLGLVVASLLAMSAPAANAGIAPDPLPSPEILAAPLALAYFVILGIRFVLEVPAGLTANWVYRVILDRSPQETSGVARKIMLTFLTPLVILPCELGYSWAWGPRVGLMHAAYVLVLSVMFTEIVLLRFHKIPFTCTLPQFQNNAIMLVFIYFIGFFLFTSLAANVERAMFVHPALFLALPVFVGLVWDTLRRIRRDTPDIDMELVYEETTPREVQTLNLSRAN